MPNETKGDPSGLPIPEANYYENAPEFHVGSWSPSPAGTPPAQYIKATQVHLRFGTPPGTVSLVRLKSARIIDDLIDALVLHREDVWGKRSTAAQAVLDKVRNDALEEAAALHESISPQSDSERATRTPGADAMGAVIEYRDKIRELKGRRPAGSLPVIPSLETKR